MANEISLTCSLSCTKATAVISATKTKVLTLVGDNSFSEIATAAFTADDALEIGSMATLGQLMVENLDATNFMQISTATGGGFAAAVIAKIRPGCVCLFQPPSATLYKKADTGDVIFKITAVEV